MVLPTLYLPHGGGPCFFMEWTMGPRDTWDRTAAWLRGIDASLPVRPRALLVVSAHWEEAVPTVTSAKRPPLLYDYSGFPPHTYELQWPASGAPEVAAETRRLLAKAGIDSAENASRGFDHGVFVPLKVAYPDAHVPTVQLSLRAGLRAEDHFAIGKALAPLREEGVLLVGSGMSYHNTRGFMDPRSLEASKGFDAWLANVVGEPAAEREASLSAWQKAPFARQCHPREEHLIPLMVTAGAAGVDNGKRVFGDVVMGVAVSAVQFG